MHSVVFDKLYTDREKGTVFFSNGEIHTGSCSEYLVQLEGVSGLSGK